MTYSHPTNAIAATRFREDRKEAGLPVATEAQVKRAQRLIEANPRYKGYHTSLGIQQLALNIPLTRFERMLNRLSTEEGGQGLILKPEKSRGDNIVVEAGNQAVEAFVEANPTMTEDEATVAIGGMHGYTTSGLQHALKRVDRYTRQPDDNKRISGHLREKMVMLSAIAQAILLIRARPLVEAVA